MTCAAETRRELSTGTLHKVAGAVRDACRRLWRAQRTRAELSALTDPELKDIGLFRGDIGRVTIENFR
jgi:uncharacterized protein YjiS (DUF1127 family)